MHTRWIPFPQITSNRYPTVKQMHGRNPESHVQVEALLVELAEIFSNSNGFPTDNVAVTSGEEVALG